MREVAIIGGGPGGSTTAALLAAAGRDVVLFEKTPFPRFHIGESLLPWNMRIFERLGLADSLRGAFMEKHGVRFVSSGGDLERTFHFDEAIDARYPVSLEVKRSEFDAMLLDHAARTGAEIRQGERVTTAERMRSGTWFVGTEGGGVEARFLVDASGTDAFLASRNGLRARDPRLRKAALFAHFRGVPRAAGRDAGNIVIVILKDGWIWFIPFLDGTTSVGLVTDGARIRETGMSPERALEEGLRRCSAARQLTAQAERITPVTSASDWTYACRRLAGDGWLLVGDAAAFVDPIFSSGVYLAMSSGEAAADLLCGALEAGRVDGPEWRRYERRLLRHVSAYRRAVDLFYTPAFARLILDPKSAFNLPGAVMSLLAGHLDHGWAVRWRLEIFYLIGLLFRTLGAGRELDLQRVFEGGPAPAPGRTRAA